MIQIVVVVAPTEKGFVDLADVNPGPYGSEYQTAILHVYCLCLRVSTYIDQSTISRRAPPPFFLDCRPISIMFDLGVFIGLAEARVELANRSGQEFGGGS